MKNTIANVKKYPVSVFYGIFLLFLAVKGSISALFSGAWDAAAVDLAMAAILIFVQFKNICKLDLRSSNLSERIIAWSMLICSNLLMLLPENNLSGSLIRAISFVLLLAGCTLFFSNLPVALHCLPATLWCCIFIPFHEELMLMSSYPLRLSATMLAALGLKICGTGVIYSGSSLHLPNLNIAITDACSGINQLDAFLLIAYIAVKMMHKKELWQILHYAFIIPSIIIANSLRIILTVLLFKICGEVILGKFWHITLGYVQIFIALLLFLAVGRLFYCSPEKTQEKTL